VPEVWRKSSYTSNEECVEVAFASTAVAIRDSKQPAGPQLSFGPDAWLALVSVVQS
jgi:Domain of unknown function (DUF397)